MDQVQGVLKEIHTKTYQTWDVLPICVNIDNKMFFKTTKTLYSEQCGSLVIIGSQRLRYFLSLNILEINNFMATYSSFASSVLKLTLWMGGGGNQFDLKQ